MGFFNWAAPLFRRADRPMDRRRRPQPSPTTFGPRSHQTARSSMLAAGPAPSRHCSPPHCRHTAHRPRRHAGDAALRTRERVASPPFSAQRRPCRSPTDSFDALLVIDAFHHMRDQDGAVREFARVTRPAARVLVLDEDRSARGMRLLIWGERLLGEPAAFFTPAEMTALMAEHGIVGECTRQAGVGYRFVGEATKA